MSKIRSGQILEGEIVGMRCEIQKEETQNKYGLQQGQSKLKR